LDAGLGVSRTLAVGVFGQLGTYGDTDGCPSCSARSIAVGPWVRYHLVQGTRFDPWLSLGLGYRLLSIDTEQGSLDYSGIDWLRVQLGGDWYATSQLGFGPLIEFDVGVYGDRPDGSGDAAAHFLALVGLRVAVDLPGK
jgi:hypothetical protein